MNGPFRRSARARSLGADGRPDLVYESLSTWSELLSTLDLKEAVTAAAIPVDPWLSVSIGIEVYSSFFRAPAGRIPLPAPTERFHGRHAIAVLGRSGRDEVAFANSWNPDWGDSGIGYLSRAYFESHVDTIWVERFASHGPSPAADAEIGRLGWLAGRPGRPTIEDVAKAWLVENRPIGKLVAHDGAAIEVRGWRTFSFNQDVSPLQTLMLRRDGILLGRAHVRHPRDTAVRVINELFVVPEERGKGYGSLLEDLCVELATSRRRSRIKLILYEADASPRNRPVAAAFAAKRGYRWRWTASRRPNVSGLGTRAI